MTPTPEGKQLAADLANAGLRYSIILAGPVIGLAAVMIGDWTDAYRHRAVAAAPSSQQVVSPLRASIPSAKENQNGLD